MQARVGLAVPSAAVVQSLLSFYARAWWCIFRALARWPSVCMGGVWRSMSDKAGAGKSLQAYFSRSSVESSPPADDFSLPESDVSSNLSNATAEGSQVKTDITDGTVGVSMDEENGDGGRSVLEPNQQRNIVFPSSKFGVQSRCFQVSWFDKLLDYNKSKDSVFCYPCQMAVKLKFTLSGKAENAFSDVGFRNWKDAVRWLKKHESSHSHRDATSKWLHYSRSQSIASQLSRQVRDDQAIAKGCLLKIITTLLFLAQQGLAVRGHDESQGNFVRLLQLHSADYPDLCMWIKQQDNWLSHDIQNEILEIMAHSLLRKLLDGVKLNIYYSIIVDEATDVAFKEQVSICLRYMSDNTNDIHEDFVGMYETGSTTAETLTLLIKDALCRFGLDLRNCCGQTYDGASNMSGRLSGVQARISAQYPKALYIHCFCHSQPCCARLLSSHTISKAHT